MTWLEFTIGALAVHRATRLLMDDTILDRPRRLLTRHPWFDDLLGCPWCISVWVAATATAAYVALPADWWLYGAVFLAWSTVASLVASHLDP